MNCEEIVIEQKELNLSLLRARRFKLMNLPGHLVRMQMNSGILGQVPSFCSSERFPGDSDMADSGTTLLSTKVWKVTNRKEFRCRFLLEDGGGSCQGALFMHLKGRSLLGFFRGKPAKGLQAWDPRCGEVEGLGQSRRKNKNRRGKKKKENQNLVPLRTPIEYQRPRRWSVEFQQVTHLSRHLPWPLLLYLL